MRIVVCGVLYVGLVLVAAPATRAQPPAGGKDKGGAKGAAQSPEMEALLKSFDLTADQRARYDAARAETSRKMRNVHQGKVDGTLTRDEVLKQALAAHKELNAKVREILTAEQYAK